MVRETVLEGRQQQSLRPNRSSCHGREARATTDVAVRATANDAENITRGAVGTGVLVGVVFGDYDATAAARRPTGHDARSYCCTDAGIPLLLLVTTIINYPYKPCVERFLSNHLRQSRTQRPLS